MQDKKFLINVKTEQSQIIEKVEELRQFVLASCMRQDRILRMDDNLDSIIYQVNIAYQDKINSLEVVGNI